MHLFVGPGPARHGRPRADARDDLVPRRAILAARGGAVGPAGQAYGVPVAWLLGGVADRVPVYASLGRAANPGAARRGRARARASEGFRAVKVRIARDRIDEGIGVVSAIRDAVGDALEIMVDLNQWWRMAGDIAPGLGPADARRVIERLRRARRAVGRGAAARRRSRRDADAARARPACGSPAARWRARSTSCGWRSRPTRSTSTNPMSCSRSGSPARARWPNWRCAATAGSPRTPGPTGSALLANLHVCCGVGGGPYLEFPYDPPGWTPERRDFMLAEPLADRRRRHGPRAGRARPRRRARRGGGRRFTPGRCASVRTEAVHRRRVRRRRPTGATFDDVSPRDGSVIAAVARGRREDVDRAVRAARRAFEDGGWALADPAQRKRVLLRLAELIDEHAEELALLESARRRQADQRCRDGRRRRRAQLLRLVRRGDRQDLRRDRADRRRRAGADHPRAARRRRCGRAVELPADHHRLEARAGARGRQHRRAQAGRAVAADARWRWPSWPPRPACPTACSTWSRASARWPAQALGRHPDVDKIAFTGSVAVGRRFSRYAGEATARRSRSSSAASARRSCWPTPPTWTRPPSAIGWGIFYNAGQTCHAGSRVVVAALGATTSSSNSSSQFARRVRASRSGGAGHHARRADQRRARRRRRSAGSTRAALGGAARAASAASGRTPVAGGAYMQPTVIEAPDAASTGDRPGGGVRAGARDPARRRRRARDRGSRTAPATGSRPRSGRSNVTTAHRFARRLRAGTVWVNTFDVSSLTTPFGGVRDSGHGRDRSLHALDAYTHLKTTWVAL